jgi:ubiquinone/menaquinone biosynthesis C-methylase UbiE
MAAQLAGNAARVGWFFGVGRLVEREISRHGLASAYRPSRPVPPVRELIAEVGRLMLADAAAVRDGLIPPAEDEADGLGAHLARLGAMIADVPAAFGRRANADAGSARGLAEAAGLPGYYTQDFHFQTGGYLTEASARIYDVQVETLFMGTANAMRRAALAPIARHLAGRDQRRLHLLDVACGTGRLLRQLRLAFPALGLSGLDLSPAYLAEARRHMGRLRPATLLAGNAEALPFADASLDAITCVFLFHELPPEVRRTVVREIARVLRPGGLMVFIDSLQMGDRPGWDGLLEAFPVRFHEPYYRHYAIDDLDGLFAGAGLAPVETRLAFLSKVMVRRRTT